MSIDNIAAAVDCPACGRKAGEACRTVIDGVDVGWTHDARFYADLRRQLRAAYATQPTDHRTTDAPEEGQP